MPSAIPTAVFTGMRSLRLPRAIMIRLTGAPWTYSMTRKTSPSSVTTSSVGTTFGCLIRETSRASSRNIATNSGSRAFCGWSRLIADGPREADRSEESPEMHRRHPARRELPVERVPADPPDVGRRDRLGGVVLGHRQNATACPVTSRKSALFSAATRGRVK